jgi:tetratricopeptide (TPR) repeat protein
VLLRVEGRYDEAEVAALEALRLAPDSVPPHNNYANLLIRRAEYDKAEEHYLKAIAIDPSSTKPYYNLACLHSLTGRTDEALEYLAKAVELDPLYRAQAISDPDLEALREMPDFARIVFQRYANGDVPDSPDGDE